MMKTGRQSVSVEADVMESVAGRPETKDCRSPRNLKQWTGVEEEIQDTGRVGGSEERVEKNGESETLASELDSIAPTCD